MPQINKRDIESAKVLRGPYNLFHESFIVEFLEPPKSLGATYVFPSPSISPFLPILPEPSTSAR